MAASRQLPRKFWIEASLALVTGVMTVVTLVSREWIELLFGFDPDQGSGLVEWLIVAGLALATVLFSLLARSEWRQAALNPS